MATRGRGRGRGRGPVVKSEPDVGAQAPAPAAAPSPAPGVKKFEPKVAPRRVKKTEVKSETGEVDAAHIQKLIQDAQDAAANRRGFRANENRVATTRVAFGSGSGAAATRSPAGFAKRSSSGTGSGGGGGGGAGANRGPDKKQELDPQTGEAQQTVAKTKVGIFDSVDDSSSYKPISLPLRRPPGFGTEFSDDEDDDDAPDKALEEDMVPPAKELGLEVTVDQKSQQTENPGERLLFLQLPSVFPASNGQTSVTSLDELSAGLMGKLRIYESGAIKLHLGKTVMDVYPGARCVFAQEVLAINSSTKKCAFLGNVGQRLVVTPDIGGLFTDHTK